MTINPAILKETIMEINTITSFDAMWAIHSSRLQVQSNSLIQVNSLKSTVWNAW